MDCAIGPIGQRKPRRGGKQKLSWDLKLQLAEMFAEINPDRSSVHSVAELAKHFNVCRATIYKAVAEVALYRKNEEAPVNASDNAPGA